MHSLLLNESHWNHEECPRHLRMQHSNIFTHYNDTSVLINEWFVCWIVVLAPGSWAESTRTIITHALWGIPDVMQCVNVKCKRMWSHKKAFSFIAVYITHSSCPWSQSVHHVVLSKPKCSLQTTKMLSSTYVLRVLCYPINSLKCLTLTFRNSWTVWFSVGIWGVRVGLTQFEMIYSIYT